MAAATASAIKRAFRKRVKDALKGLETENVGLQSSVWTKTITSLPEYWKADRISVYLSMPKGELQTAGLVADAFKRGKSLFIPYIHHLPPTAAPIPIPPHGKPVPTSQMDMLSLSSPQDYSTLPPDAWGIPSIPSTSVSSRQDCLQDKKGLDLVILPGVAFGVDGRRLGHGKGYYDMWLARYFEEVGRERGMPVLVGAALKEQVIEAGRVPVDETDWEVDVVVTGDGRVIRRGEGVDV
ncbi:5-formyltetrahydrofolate cyclo-ligase [Terfezia boudieri ATCC MYA-4762]|uniref:5-formyltetrahydrofolate cyclo-ligase n=1 Tax=Terfezia boudieri ATCC MYA-4762 TaxID=1051890 RepID=A0A3N4LZE3_9PEZI|nr:5-formyltetrahydrofolate cyclo-ligase [Terfezia boudieri ATCC MYA-4762]